MYCRFCGTEINNHSRFCSTCGKPQDSVKKSPANVWPRILYYTLGVIFILGGILPYLLQEDLTEYTTYLSSLCSQYSSPTEISAISCFTQFVSFLSPLFYFSSSILAIYIGFLLIKKEARITVPTIICTILHLVSIIYSVVINLLIYSAPELVLSLYTSDASVITAGEEIINSAPDMLYYYHDTMLCRLFISVILITLAIIFLFVQKRYMNNSTNDSTYTVSIGSVMMILCISILSVVSSMLSPLLLGGFGNYAVAANSIAKLSFNLNIRYLVIFAFIIIIGLAVLFTRIKRWIIAIPTISIVAILGFVAFLFSNTFIKDLNAPMEIFSMASNNLRGAIISSVVILTAMFYWFSSVSRNKIPTWLQIALPLSLPIIYIGIEISTTTILPLNSGISFGLIFVALITIMVSLLVRLNKQNKAQNI